MAENGQNEGTPNPLQLAYEEASNQLAQAKEEIVYWRNSAAAAARHSQVAEGNNTSIEGLDIYLLRVDNQGIVQYINTAFCRYIQVSRTDVEGHPVRMLNRFLDDAMVELLCVPTENDVIQISDETHNTVLEMKLTWKNGALDAVIQDVTSNVQFRNYVLKYIPSALRDMPEEDLYTFRYPDRRFMTASFTDLRGFTALTETLGPEEVRSTLNNYLEEVIAAIEENLGTVDKIIGDEVMALFGAPRYFRDHALRAIKTACDQQQRIRKLQATFLELGKQLPDCGIGINTGDMIVGNVGSSSRQDYTVLGGAVNLASHLCSAARGGEILISETTLREALALIPEYWQTLETTWDSSSDTLYVGGKVEGVYLLEGDRLNKAILVGPDVQQNPANAEFCFRYLYSLKIKGITDLVPVISVTSPKDDSTLALDPNQVIQVSPERILGKYRLQEIIGRGGMGEIWLAKDGFGNVVAIKTLIAGEAASEKQIKRFKREAETMAKLVHRSICRVLEVGEIDHISYIAMEYVNGVDLADLLIYKSPTLLLYDLYRSKPIDLGALVQEVKSNRDSAEPTYDLDPQGEIRFRILPERQIIEILLKTCSAVQYAHSHGVLHRDIKPANIMIRTDGEPIVTDFGLAKVQSDREDISLSITGQLVGTLEYMAPEQANDSHAVAETVDVYSLGAILYLMVTGHKHFSTTGNILADINTLQHHEPIRPKIYNKNIDPDLETIILKALSPDPTSRYRNVVAFRSDIERYKNGEVISAKEQSLIEVFSKTIKRNKAVSIAIASSLIILLVASVFYIQSVNAKNAELSKVIAQMERANTERKLAEEKTERTTKLVEVKEKEVLEKDKFAREKEKQAQASSQQYEKIKDSVTREFLELASEASKRNRHNDAVEYAEKALDKDRNNPELWWQYGNYLEKANRIDDARTSYQTAIRINPSENRYRESHRGVDESIRHASTFIGKYERSILSSAPISQADHIQAGDYYFEKNKYLEAAKSYERANTSSDAFSIECRIKQFNAEGRNSNPKFDTSKNRFKIVDGKIIELDLRNDPSTSIPSLSKLEIHKVNAANASLSTLTPFIGSNIKILDLSKTKIDDITPLTKIPLEELILDESKVQDISPIQNMSLKSLSFRNGNILDYSVFSGLSIDSLNLSETKISDLSKLGLLRVRELNLTGTPVQNLTFTPGARVKELNISGTRVTNLEPLAGQPIESLDISRTRVGDLSPITYNVMRRLNLSGTTISTLDPVRRMPLQELDIRKTMIDNLSPLLECPLEIFYLDPEKIISGMDVIRRKTTIKQIGRDKLLPPDQFWKAYDAGEFSRSSR